MPLMQGSMPEVITLQTSCEASGIPTFVPDINLMQADPFIRGGNGFSLQLCVPEDRLAEARALLPERMRTSSSALAIARNPIDALGSQVRWCCVLLITAPLGVWFGLRYLVLTHKLEQKPAEHAWTVGAFWLSFLLVLVLAARIVVRSIHR